MPRIMATGRTKRQIDHDHHGEPAASPFPSHTSRCTIRTYVRYTPLSQANRGRRTLATEPRCDSTDAGLRSTRGPYPGGHHTKLAPTARLYNKIVGNVQSSIPASEGQIIVQSLPRGNRGLPRGNRGLSRCNREKSTPAGRASSYVAVTYPLEAERITPACSGDHTNSIAVR